MFASNAKGYINNMRTSPAWIVTGSREASELTALLSAVSKD